MWRRRHRLLVLFLVVHTLALAVWSLAASLPVLRAAAHLVPLALTIVLACVPRLPRALRANLVVLGTVSGSLLLSDLTGGMVAAQFYFLAAMALVSLYQQWSPFLLAVASVAVSRGLLATYVPELVYGRHLIIGHPWLTAGYHAVAVLVAGAANLTVWAAAERTAARHRQVRRHAELLQAAVRYITEQVHFVTGFEEAAQVAIDRIVGEPSSPWVVGHLFLLDPATRTYRSTSVWSTGATERFGDFVAATATLTGALPEARSLGFIAAAHAGALRWAHADELDAAIMRRRAAVAGSGFRTGVAVPIFVGREVSGVLELFSFDDVAAEPQHEDTLLVVGAILGRVLERERSARRLAQQLHMTAAITDAAVDAILTIDDGGRITTWNHAAEQMFQYRADEIIGRAVNTVLPTVRIKREQRMTSCDAVRSDGQVFPTEVTVSPSWRQDDVLRRTVIIRDVTERHVASQRIAELAARNDALLRSVGQAIVGLDAAGRITFANPAAETVLGAPAADLAGRAFSDLVPCAPTLDGVPSVREGRLPTRDGDIPVEVRMYPLSVNDVTEQGGVAIVIDISERLAAATARQLQKEAQLNRRHALQFNDRVVQGIITALYAFELDQKEEAMATLQQTASTGRRLISDLLAEGSSFDESLLRRDEAADVGGGSGDRVRG